MSCFVDTQGLCRDTPIGRLYKDLLLFPLSPQGGYTFTLTLRRPHSRASLWEEK